MPYSGEVDTNTVGGQFVLYAPSGQQPEHQLYQWGESHHGERDKSSVAIVPGFRHKPDVFDSESRDRSSRKFHGTGHHPVELVVLATAYQEGETP
jgi:hypothetical protein